MENKVDVILERIILWVLIPLCVVMGLWCLYDLLKIN